MLCPEIPHSVKSSFGIESSKSSTSVNEKFSNRVGICHIVCRGINKKITVALLSQVQILPGKTVPPPLDLSREETQKRKNRINDSSLSLLPNR
jgi:hypothetical protein